MASEQPASQQPPSARALSATAEALHRGLQGEASARGSERPAEPAPPARTEPAEGRSPATSTANPTATSPATRGAADREMAERALRAEQELRVLLANLPGGAAFVVGPDLVYTMAEGDALAAAGVRSADLVGRTLREALGPELAAEHEPHYRGVFEGRSFVLEHGAHGRWFVTRGVPLRDAQGRIYAALAFSHDITERKEAEEELRGSEQRLQLALDAAALGRWEWDLARGQVTMSERARALFGVVDAELPISIEVFESLLHPDDVARNRGRAREALARGDFTSEFRVLHRDGQQRVLQSRARVLRDPDGEPRRMIGVIADLTEQRAAEAERESKAAELAAAEQRYRAFLELSSEGIWRLELDPPVGTALPTAEQVERIFERGRMAECNDVMARMVGLDGAPNLVGRSLAMLMPPSDPRSRAAIAAFVEAGHRLADVEWMERDVRGRERWFVVAMHGVVTDGCLRRVWGTQRDVTERKAQQAELIEADRRKDRFLATLSHELRNPLAPLRTAARLLAMPGAVPEQAARAQAVIERQTRHMSLLLDDLLDMARITQGKLVLKTERLAVVPLVEAAVEAARPALDERRHTLEIVRPDAGAPPLEVEGDPLRLTQVLGNLLANAARYTPPGGHVKVAVSATDDAQVAIEVADDGMGIAPEAIDSIFSMFVQAPDPGSGASYHGGLGIGLAIVKGLVELHGGSVAARSAGPGRGSAFTVHLPLLPALHTTPGSAARGAAPASLAEGRRILVADDNVDAAEMLAAFLRLSGHEVSVAIDGLHALELAERERPHFALLDIGMPGLDGYALAQRLRGYHWGRSMRLVALTGWGQAADQHRAFAAGFDMHFTKPVDLDALDRWIARH